MIVVLDIRARPHVSSRRDGSRLPIVRHIAVRSPPARTSITIARMDAAGHLPHTAVFNLQRRRERLILIPVLNRFPQ